MALLPLEVWSPLPPSPSGVADYVAEQLPPLSSEADVSVVVERAADVSEDLTSRFRVVEPADANPRALRVYHVGNSPAHGFIYDEALRTPGVLFLHEWNLHELLLGFAVRSHDFAAYRAQMRREHGERGSIAAGAIADALGGKHWTSVFPLNAEVLKRALAVVCLSEWTARKAEARLPGTPVLRLKHHALLPAKSRSREEARARLDLPLDASIVLAPGLGTASKSLDAARAAVAMLRLKGRRVLLVSVGGGSAGAEDDGVKRLGRVSLQDLGDAILAADVVLALRFPSRGEVSGVLMRSLAAGRACVITAGSTADEELPAGAVACVSPGPSEVLELAAVIDRLLLDQSLRSRIERFAREEADRRPVASEAGRLAAFLGQVEASRIELERRVSDRRVMDVSPLFLADLESAVAGFGLAQVPRRVFEKIAGLL